MWRKEQLLLVEPKLQVARLNNAIEKYNQAGIKKAA
jgi:hypothetical protein